MSDSHASVPASSDATPTEDAEHSPLRACSFCREPISDAYFETNGRIVCPSCRAVMLRASTGRAGRFGRFIRAFVFGAPAAFLGFLACFAVVKLAGAQFSRVSIPMALLVVAIGPAVGVAVRIGSSRRGGWLYQGMAIFLTYTAIVASVVVPKLPEMIQSVQKKMPVAQAREGAPEKPGVMPKGEGTSRRLVPLRREVPPERPVIALAMLAVLLCITCYIWPIVLGFESQRLLLIIGLALFGAWAFNRRTPPVFRGPFRNGGELPLANDLPTTV